MMFGPFDSRFRDDNGTYYVLVPKTTMDRVFRKYKKHEIKKATVVIKEMVVE